MVQVNVHDLVHKRALITRQSAEPIRAALLENAAADEVVLDFEHIEAVTPAFVDEILEAVDGAIARQASGNLRVLFRRVPTRLSSKFAAVGRARNLEVTEEPGGTWVVTKAAGSLTGS